MKKNLVHEASAEHATPPHERPNRPALAPELKAAWVKALRSGEYKQCTMSYARGGAYCCLGVLAVITNGPNLRPLEFAQLFINGPLEKMVPAEVQSPLVSMNDDERRTFPEIADYIEANL